MILVRQNGPLLGASQLLANAVVELRFSTVAWLQLMLLGGNKREIRSLLLAIDSPLYFSCALVVPAGKTLVPSKQHWQMNGRTTTQEDLRKFSNSGLGSEIDDLSLL